MQRESTQVFIGDSDGPIILRQDACRELCPHKDQLCNQTQTRDPNCNAITRAYLKEKYSRCFDIAEKFPEEYHITLEEGATLGICEDGAT